MKIAGGTSRDGEGEIAPGCRSTAVPLALAQRSDVLIDFSVPGALSTHLDACIAAKKPVLIGTTGLEPAHHALIDEAAKRIPLLQTGNTRSEEHTSELQSLMRISYAVFCLKKKNPPKQKQR